MSRGPRVNIDRNPYATSLAEPYGVNDPGSPDEDPNGAQELCERCWRPVTCRRCGRCWECCPRGGCDEGVVDEDPVRTEADED